jgi:hypothetical protein
MGGGMKGSQTQKTSQTNEPPAWAKPLLTQAASSAQNLFNSGQGYNVYRGPTQADMSPEKLQALNNMMKMTGGNPAGPITNERMTGSQNSQIQQVQALINQQQQQRAAYQAQQAAAAAAAAAAAKKPAAAKPKEQYNMTSQLRGQGSNR